jgi:hypothetical protein
LGILFVKVCFILLYVVCPFEERTANLESLRVAEQVLVTHDGLLGKEGKSLGKSCKGIKEEDERESVTRKANYP